MASSFAAAGAHLMMRKSSKLQHPSAREAPSLQSSNIGRHCPSPGDCAEAPALGAWYLELLWNLVLGGWCFGHRIDCL